MRALCWILMLSAPACAQPGAIELLERKTLAELEHFDRGFDGVLGVAAIDLETGHSFAWNGDTQFAQASVIKIPILAAMYRAAREDRFHLDGKITLAPGDAVGGSGDLQYALKKGPVTLTVRQLIEAMVVQSDNTATNRCIDMLGMDSVNRMLAGFGLSKTRLQRKMMDGAAALRNDENISTPNEMARLLELIYRAKAVDRRAADEMMATLKRVRGGIAQGLPLDIETAVKTGELPGARGEAGIVFLAGRPFVLSVMSSFIDDSRTPVPEVTRIIFRYFEKLAASNAYGNRLR